MFKVEPRGWGINIEATYQDADWLAEFLRTKTRTPQDLEKAEQLYKELVHVLGLPT